MSALPKMFLLHWNICSYLISPVIFIKLVWVQLLYSTFVSGSLLQDFESPTSQYRPKFRYWLPDASIPPEVLKQDIANIAEVGAGGLEFLPFYLYGNPSEQTPPTDWDKYAFGTPAFREIFQVALEASRTNDLLFDFSVGANQGQGVPSVPGTNGLAVELIYGHTTILAGDKFNGSLPEGKKDFQQLIGFMNALEPFGTNTLVAVIAGKIKSREATTISIRAETTPGYPMIETVLDETTIIELTSRVVNGSLDWTPDSNSSYSVIAFYERYTNQRSCSAGIGATDFIGNGSWTVDHFSTDGGKRTTDFLDEHLIYGEVKDLLASVGKYSWEDSMEMQFALPWTPGFLERFEKSRGYSAAKYLPLMFNVSNQWGQSKPAYNETWVFGEYDSNGKSVHLSDYQKTLNECYQDYLKHFDQWAHSLGLMHSAQPSYNFPLDMLADVPLVEVPELESLGFSENIDNYRQFTGPAHLSGHNVISTEVGAVQGAAYSQKIPDLLRLFKGSFAAGVNMMVMHGAAYSGEYPETTWPGYTSFNYIYTEQWNSKQPAWRHLKDSTDYTARNQLVLQAGIPRTDVAFYLFKNPWNRGEIYQDTNLKTLGYTYEYLTADNLLSPQAVVKSGILAPEGPAYKALVISNQTHMSLEAAEKLHDFAAAGLPIIFIGSLPSYPISTDRNASLSPLPSLQSLVASPSSVKVLGNADELPAYLQSLGVRPRASMVSGGSDVYTFWRTVSEEDIELVFMFNHGSDTVVQFEFGVADKAPNFLNTWTGIMEPVMIYNSSSSGISTSIKLKANQTKVIAFTRSANYSGVHVQTSTATIFGFSQLNDTSVSALLTGPGIITLSNGHSVPVNATTLPSLVPTSWTLNIQSYHPTDNINSTRNEVTPLPPIALTSLTPWTNIPSLQKISGIGTYNTTFSFPYDPSSVAAIIEFGPVLNTLRASVNGQNLPPVDPTDPWIDASNWVREGENELSVEVSSTLFNAVKARMGEIMTAGVPLTSSNAGGYQGDWAEFGLLGPVVVRCFERVSLEG